MIVYLHGFSSAGNSSKADHLRQILDTHEIISPTYPSHAPHEAISQLQQLLSTRSQMEPIKLIGSSLGGYYAQYLASIHEDARVVLINPALNPMTILRPFIGQNENYVTGELFEFTVEQHRALGEYDIDAGTLAGRSLILLDEGDELIDYRYAQERYNDIGVVKLYPGGSHRFDHLDESLPLIRDLFEI